MEDSQPGPSGIKKPRLASKTTFKRYLTEEELEKMLYESDDNLEDPTFIDDDAEGEELDIEAETPLNLPSDEEPEDEAADNVINGQATPNLQDF
ncbi:hypothetical protein ILUMI_23821 [Ignelater luminosus]|uniref:Uncharacterized protein n=1 Tax=Ignelater luminosus TaxID=2038154 RepID=A0A8K0C855_IGNLU|nr:hypothetical protein ILUMI_23821 [Ignelater luminosus]